MKEPPTIEKKRTSKTVDGRKLKSQSKSQSRKVDAMEVQSLKDNLKSEKERNQ